MNAAGRRWKEAATVILAAGHRLGSAAREPPPLAPHLPHVSCFDYDVLLLKRSGKSGFMPNAYVFPGGVAAPADFSADWLDVFESHRKSPNFGLRSVKQPPETRPPIYATDRLQLGSPIPGEVAFRICALRETFEESGILLVVPASRGPERTGDGSETRTLHCEVSDICSSERIRWRTLVNQDPSNFIRMCRELQVLPNIWALHEWGNWLTPAGRGARFDTAFFICCLQETPHTLQDQREIVRFQWSTPSEVLHSYQSRDLWIAPPQFYELSRLCRFPLLDDLHDFARRRAAEGCEQWLPVVVPQDEHHISLLPGDRLYPLSPGEAAAEADTRIHQEDPPEGSGLHRIQILDPYTAHLQISITPKYKHLLPVVPQSKL